MGDLEITGGAPSVDGLVEQGELRTWYMVVGDLDAARTHAGPAPLVTIHGGPGATHDYLLSMVDLARDGRAVVFYDQIGNGRSAHFRDRGVEFFTVALFVDELARLIEHLGIGHRYHILGQSWGGMLALEHLLTAPSGLRSRCAFEHRRGVPVIHEGGEPPTCRPPRGRRGDPPAARGRWHHR